MQSFYRRYRKVGDSFEHCFYVETSAPFTLQEVRVLKWLLAETFDSKGFNNQPFLISSNKRVIELGPRLSFATAFSTNAVAICHSIGLNKVTRIERSRRCFVPKGATVKGFIKTSHDRMTECHYPEPLHNFGTEIKAQPVSIIPLIKEGISALQRINKEIGLGMDEWDLNFYYNLFANDMRRNPTNVECFQLGQANSEHSRHWFFKGTIVIDGVEIPEALLDIVRSTLKANPTDSIIAFKDNSSAITGYDILTIIPWHPGKPSHFKKEGLAYHLIFTAETHNFPSGVAPFPGAETGTGGRIRDIQATGRGGLVIAGTAAYCVGNLHIPGYELPWEDKSFKYPGNLASSLTIAIQASNGASDYGNKFGEPVIQGFTRSFGMKFLNRGRREWLKPIMFTGGIGQMDARHVKKGEPQKGMLIVQIGGPAYRIGMGGGSASSMIQGQNVAELDFNAVQRGDAEMEQKMNRVIRTCIEMEKDNPIISIHDQGAGGPCNVLTELINPAGGRIEIRKIRLGDETLSILEIWGAEYQERNALLIYPDRVSEFLKICCREKVDCEILGEITGDGKIVVRDALDDSTPVNLELSKILGNIPQKVFKDNHIQLVLKELTLPEKLTVEEALEKVLRLLSVGSKRFLTNKVDRSVTGLIARQQCCGPLQLTVSDVAVVAQSHFGLTGAAIAIGEQPIKMLVDPRAGARMAVVEALTNLVWAKIKDLSSVKCSANWMWAAKLSGEGANLCDAAMAMRDIMIKLGIAVDGGKDSLSMAAKVGEEIVKAPGQLVISAYAAVPDITKVITPDIKGAGNRLYHLDFAMGKKRLGGSALAHVFGQIGDNCPDVEDAQLIKDAFSAIQEMIEKNLILSGHDISDGGLIVTLLEMAFSGNCGFIINVECEDAIAEFFAEEAGVVIEISPRKENEFMEIVKNYKLPWRFLGLTLRIPEIVIRQKRFGPTTEVLQEDMRTLRSLWEQTSYQIERLQVNPQCAEEERENIYDRPGPFYITTFKPEPTPPHFSNGGDRIKVAIIREEGSNGDREMTSAFYQAGFNVWDITITDLLSGQITLDLFRGAAFVGGFSYADVLDSAKGWAGTIRFNKKLRAMFDKFYNRPDTFSLGVCNGCQLMALLGWVPWKGIQDEIQPRFIRNISNRFESRWTTVRILPSPAIMLKGMEGSVLGIWVAHGEGKVYFPEPEEILGTVGEKRLAPIRYVDDKGDVTGKYPFNPNGSPFGIAALCSPDGRHLAMMPHPERAFLLWQWSWLPEEWRKNRQEISPWLRLFQNAREWCEKTE